LDGERGPRTARPGGQLGGKKRPVGGVRVCIKGEEERRDPLLEAKKRRVLANPFRATGKTLRPFPGAGKGYLKVLGREPVRIQGVGRRLWEGGSEPLEWRGSGALSSRVRWDSG